MWFLVPQVVRLRMENIILFYGTIRHINEAEATKDAGSASNFCCNAEQPLNQGSLNGLGLMAAILFKIGRLRGQRYLSRWFIEPTASPFKAIQNWLLYLRDFRERSSNQNKQRTARTMEEQLPSNQPMHNFELTSLLLIAISTTKMSELFKRKRLKS